MNNEKFTTKNAFSMLAYLATEKHIEGQELKHPLGKIDCYIFYSTYISLLTSYLQLSNTDNVDIYLTKGIKDFIDYLEIDCDALMQYRDIDDYILARSNFYIKHFKQFPDFNFNSPANYPYFLKCFEIEDPILEKLDYDETAYIDVFDIMTLKLTFAVVIDNINVIDKLYDSFNEYASDYKLSTWEYNKPKLLSSPFDFIEKLVVNPFQEARCQICGNFNRREKLELVPINDCEFGGLILPVCLDCKKKHVNSSGFIEV